MHGSLPPHSMTTGVNDCAQAAITLRPLAGEPVKAILSAPAAQSAAPNPVTTPSTPAGASGFAAAKDDASRLPNAGVYSLGLNTTGLPAARAYAIEPTGVSSG